MKKCDACKKRAEGLGTYPTQFYDIVLCSDCYEAIFPDGRKYRNLKGLEQLSEAAKQHMETRGDDEVIVANVNRWLEEEKRKYKGKVLANQAIEGTGNFMMTTCHEFTGYHIVSYHGVVTGESVLGTGVFSSLDASVSDMLGEESNLFIEKLGKARNAAMKRLIRESVQRGGNAVVGIDIEYTMFFSNMIGVMITGTSVQIKKDAES